MNAPVVTLEVAKRFASLRRRYTATRIGITFAIAVMVLISIWIALAAGDYTWEWPRTVRSAGLTIGIAAAGAWLVWRLHSIAQDTLRRRFVARLERSYEGFGQRIRTVLDAADGRVRGPSEMLAALGHQTLGRWETLMPSRLVPARGLALATGGCLSALLLAAGLLLIGGDWRSAMLRAVGSEVPYTRLAVTPGDTRLLEGSAVQVALELSGRTGRDVVLRYRELRDASEPDAHGASAASQWTEEELLPSPPDDDTPIDSRRAVFAAGLGKASYPIEYQFATSAGSTRVFRIDVQPRIAAQRIETVVTPPAYTGLEQRSFTSAEITVLEQSDVTVTIQTTHPLDRATLQVGSKPSELQTADATPSDNATLWSFPLPSLDSLHWRFSGEGDDGTPMLPVTGRLRVQRDRAPVLSWRDPPDQIRVHTLAELPMRVHVSDDYGIAQSGLVFQLGDEEYVLADWAAADADPQAVHTTGIRLEETLPLESFGLSERDFIAYYAYAIDNRGSAPQRSESDLRYIDIRPLRQFYAEREGELDPAGGGGVLVQLYEIIRRQRFLINQTRKLVRGSSPELSMQLGRIDRMVKAQSELAGLTRLLSDFFVSRGNDDVEVLSQAEAAMLQAADSLAAGTFDLALVQEEDALRALAEARRTLEISLQRNMSPNERQALRRLAQQLRQKLRRERPETEQEIADTLQQLAVDQTRLGQTAASLQQQMTAGGGGQSDRQPESAPDEPSLSEQQDALFASQVDLLERLRTIEEQLTDRLDQSPLMTERMEQAKAALDQLGKQSRDGQLGPFAADSTDAADQLRELGVQLDALAATEPVSRVLAVRDMTRSLTDLERRLGEQLGGAAESSAAKSDPESDADALSRLAKRMQRRSETIEDVLKSPVNVGDLEASEVTENLDRFIEEVGFMDQLEATRQAADSLADTPGENTPASKQAHRRAVEYAAAAQRLDDLYRQLVTPRLARLRQIEQQASELARRIGDGKASEESAEAKAGAGKLQSDLEQEGLDELAELLAADNPIDEPLGDPSASGSEFAGGYEPARGTPLSGRVLLVAKELQDRIQEMILLETSADRDIPVPAQYRTAVDRYFSVIVGGGDPLAEEQDPGQ